MIGAGVAGLTAANIAHTAGHDVTVLEARPRTGGRTWTVPFGAGHVDLGAAWIHGLDGNPLMALFEALGVEVQQTEAFRSPVSVTTPDGSRWSHEQVDTFVSLWERFDAEALQRVLGPRASVREAVDRFAVDQGLTPTEEMALRFVIEDLDTGLNIAASADDASIHGYVHYDMLDEEDAIPRSGYGRLVDALAEPLTVELDTPVEMITWSAEGATARSGTRTWEAEAMVVAVPLAVLKSGAPAFSPALPEAKRGAIAALGVADLRKVVFLFDDVHWADERYWLHRSEPPGEFPFAIDLHPIRGAPIIELEYTGRAPAASLSPDDLERAALAALRLMLGAHLPDPVAALHSPWHDDPYSRGSYSYLPVGASAADMDELGAPVGPLHFAGEATFPRFYGTVHAAYLSGRRAATEIVGHQNVALSFLDPAPTAPPRRDAR